MGTDYGRKIISAIIVFLYLLLLSGCNKHKEVSHEQIRNKLQELINKGYTVKELSLRTPYMEKELIACLCGEELKNNYFDLIDWIYKKDKEGDMIPVHKVDKTATECLRAIYNKTHGILPILSLHLNVDVIDVSNALTEKRGLCYEDSLKVIIAYINLDYQLDSISMKFNVNPYYYKKNEGVGNISIPQQSTFVIPISANTDSKLAYYVWQAEQFEFEANKNLEQSINRKINDFASKQAESFIEDDINNIVNDVKVLLKNDDERKEFYIEKLKKRLNISGLNEEIKEEIISYCVSVNCSRILTINEILGYNQLTNNLSVVQKVQLDSFTASMENINSLIRDRQIDHAKTAAGTIASLLAFIAAPAGAPGRTLAFLAMDAMSWQDAVNQFDYLIRGKEAVDIDKQIQDFQDLIYLQIKDVFNKQLLNGKDNYKTNLDHDTKNYYGKMKKSLGLI